MFNDMRVDRFHDSEEIRCNKVYNMINMIRCDITFEKPIFDSEVIKSAESLLKEISKLKKE